MNIDFFPTVIVKVENVIGRVHVVNCKALSIIIINYYNYILAKLYAE